MNTPIQLSADELAAIERGEPLHLSTTGGYPEVLMLGEKYECLKHFIDFADADPKALYPLIVDVSPDDWEELLAYPKAAKLRRSSVVCGPSDPALSTTARLPYDNWESGPVRFRARPNFMSRCSLTSIFAKRP